MSNFQEKISFIWDLADLLRGVYKRNEYQKVILPFTQAVPQINYRILLYIKTMTINQQKSKVHDTPRGNMNKNLNT
ncbi:MAG: type I restriction-modification system subunit M N-terminal domain-containing protein, partial [Halobacteriota archaeon]